MDFSICTYFRLSELIYTSHRSINNNPSEEVVERLRCLGRNYLDLLRAKFGPLFCTSGYRCPELNTAIGGAKDSAHLYGCAADLVPLSPTTALEAMMAWVVKESGLDYDQVILEQSSTGRWLHFGILRPNHEPLPRREALTYFNGSYAPYAVR